MRYFTIVKRLPPYNIFNPIIILKIRFRSCIRGCLALRSDCENIAPDTERKKLELNLEFKNDMSAK